MPTVPAAIRPLPVFGAFERPRWRTVRRRALLARAAMLAAVLAAIGGGIGALRIHNLGVALAPRFDTALWLHPSRIYSRPLVVDSGSPITRDDLEARLLRSGYTDSGGLAPRPGQYRAQGPDLELNTRAFDSADGHVPAQAARISFAPSRRVALVRPLAAGQQLPHLVLEPELLATLHGSDAEERTVLPLSEFPPALVSAVIAAEDRRFYSHPGIDPLRIARALWVNLRHGEIMQGASTITQQTVKNVFLDSERTWSRKLREAQLALALEAQFSKDKILEVYLNEVYLGQRDGIGVCGFGEASRFYFGKDVQQLDLDEVALLAGLIPAPSAYNPYKHPEQAVARRDRVLRLMREQELIDEAAYREARGRVLNLARSPERLRGASHFVQLVRKQLREAYSAHAITSEGLRVYTTLDTQLQGLAERAVREGLSELERRRPALVRRGAGALEGALVVLRPATGEILAYVGGRDFNANQFDHVSQAHRQAGSLFKPLVYLAGFERAQSDPTFAFTPATMLEDAPFEIMAGNKLWQPHNYDEEFRGWVSTRQALEESLNVPAVRASHQIGLLDVADVARRAGVDLPGPAYPSIALGAEEVTPLQIAAVYAMIASGGVSVEPWSVLEVRDRSGRVLERSVPRTRPVVAPVSAFLTLDLMRGVLDRGTAQRVRGAGLRGDLAGKTGTTNEKRDAWFVGFSPELLAASWVGYDDNATTGLTGASGALPLWINLMKALPPTGSTTAFAEPPGIERALIDPRTGGLATPDCPEVLVEVFAQGTTPLAECPEHTPFGADAMGSLMFAGGAEPAFGFDDAELESRRLRSWKRAEPAAALPLTVSSLGAL